MQLSSPIFAGLRAAKMRLQGLKKAQMAAKREGWALVHRVRERELQTGGFLLKAPHLRANVTTFETLSTRLVSGVTKPHVTPPTALP